MAKDSKDSFEQRMWELAVKHHTEYVEMIKTVRQNSHIEFKLNERITDYETRYPQLKQK